MPIQFGITSPGTEVFAHINYPIYCVTSSLPFSHPFSQNS